MSQENVEVVRRMLEQWNAGAVDGWLHCWHIDAEWISEPFAAFEGKARTYRGHDGLRRFTGDLREAFADLGRFERPRLRAVGDSILVLANYRARAGGGGPEVATPMAWLFEVRDGKIARSRDSLDPRQALEAVGLSE